MGLSGKLAVPQKRRDFTCEWARQIVVDFKSRTDPGWLLADMLKVMDVTVSENVDPGMLSYSYFVQVSYKEDSKGILRIDSWFVKIPKSGASSPMDAVEAFMYNTLIPNMQAYVKKALSGRYGHELPVPKGLYCHHEEDISRQRNILVLEDLQSRRFKPLKGGVCGVMYMRAQMRALASVHAAALAYQEELGGKRAFLRKNPLIKERTLPKMNVIRKALKERLLPYLAFLTEIQPDLEHQLKIFMKFERHLPKVFKNIHDTPGLHDMKTMVHGDSKLDNFLFKKAATISADDQEEYDAVLIDWQGSCYDYLSSDVMWALYGFMKNLPDKNSTVDTFLDYSVAFYHQELLKRLKTYKLTAAELSLPDNEYDGVGLIKRGFVYDFLRVVLVRPVLSLQDPKLLLDWYANRGDGRAVPSPADVFRGGQSSVSFVHLYFTIATEIGVFHELAPLCFAALKEAMFASRDGESEDDDDDEEGEKAFKVNGATNSEAIITASQAVTPSPPAAPTAPPIPVENGNSIDTVKSADMSVIKEPVCDSSNDDHVPKRPSFLRRESTITLPDVLDDSDDDEYEYHEDNKSVITKTVYIRTASMEGC